MNEHTLTKNIRANLFRGAGGGAKGGGASHTPIEAPDSLRSIAYAKILDLVSEGEIAGWVHPDNPLQDVYLNETPVANEDGSLNFKNIQMDFRSGTQDQDYIPGFEQVANEIGVGLELRDDVPWTRAVTNLNLSSIRVRLSVLALSKANTSNGDINGYSVSYSIDLATDGGAFETKLNAAFTGKTSTKYERGHEIVLPPATTGWVVRVRRTTANADSAAIGDTTYVESYAEIIDTKFRMPMSAVVGMKIDAEQFSNIPARAFHLRGRIIKVPSNYDPDTRAYDGVWDGTFQVRYSNNPAWVFYDMAHNRRYGAGRRLLESMGDKWALYQIAQYCDELVPDGRGGMEPRFTCNLYLQRDEDATRVMQSLATIFRGIMYASGSTITAVADMPQDPIYTYTPANVIDGKFTYSGTDRKVRHTTATVSYNDPQDFGRAKLAYYQNDAGIARYGIQNTDSIALGCNSYSQAFRMAKYIVITELYETDAVVFGVGLDGTVVAPGKIVYIADPLRAGERRGGRIASATANSVVIDAMPPTPIVAGDTMILVHPNATIGKYIVDSVAGRTITCTTDFDFVPMAESVWITESSEVVAQQFRILGVLDSDDGSSYNINAIQHVPGKFDAIELDLVIDEPPISLAVQRVIFPPTDITVTWRDVADINTTTQIGTATWTPVPGAIRYNMQYRVENSDWVNLGDTPGNNRDFLIQTPGNFYLRICAINVGEYMSGPAFAGPFTVTPNEKPPGFVEDLEISIAEALLTAENAAAVADGAVVSFWQTSPPVIGSGAGEASEGDIWFDTNDGNKIYRVVSGAWVDAQDDALATALAAASTAQATADGKVKTYFQSTAPVNVPTGTLVLGDLWFDTTAGVGKLYRWSGTSWSQNIGDITADQLGGNGTNLIWDEYSRYQGLSLPATTISGGFTRAFDATDRAVGGTSYGSLKITANGSGTAIGDTLWLGNSATDYNVPISPNGKYIVSARVKVGTAGHKIGLVVKDSAGTTYSSGDITVASSGAWTVVSFLADLSASAANALIVGVQGNRSNVAARVASFDGLMVEPQIGTKVTPSAWVPGAAGRNALVAIANAALAQSTADGKIDSFYQTSPPVIGSGAGQARDGDIWFDTDDGNKIYTVVSGSWVATPDSRIATAIAAAGTAQSTADGKSTLFYAVAASPPTATGVGDLWFQTDTKAMKRWNGSAWVDNGVTLALGQTQNGVVLPFTFGDELCPNPSFDANASGTRKTTVTSYAAGVDICDGWRVFANTGAGFVCGLDTFGAKSGTYVLFIGTGGQMIPASSSVETYVQVAADSDVKEGEQYAFSAWMRWDASAALPAGMTGKVRFGAAFYNAAGGFVSESYIDQAYATASQKDGTITVPTGAARMKIMAYANLTNTNGVSTATGATPLNARFDNVSVKKLSITGNNPNLIPNSDLSNGLTGWSGSGVSVVKDTEAYRLQTGVVADNVTHDITSTTISLPGFGNTEVTFSCEGVNAGTLTGNSYMRLQIEWFAGASSLGFSAVSNQLDNTTPTDRYSKMVVTARAPATTDGAKVYLRSRGGGLFIYRRMKLERGGVMTPYTRNAEQVYGQELTYGTSNRRLGDARNMRQAQTAGVGAIASNGVITAASTGTISVAAFTMSYGGSVTISYSANATAVTGLTQNVTYYIYCIDDDYTGGSRTWLAATTLQAAMNAGVGVVIAGQVKVPTSGSTSPPDPSDPACPLAKMVTPENRPVGNYVEGEWMACWNLDVENPGIVMRQVRNNKVVMQPAACLHAENGCEIEQSLSTPMRLMDGTYRKTHGMFGQKMLTFKEGEWEWSQVTDIRDLGMQLVAEVDLDDSILLAGRTVEEQVATHNIKWKP